MGPDRQEKALREYKQIMTDLVHLLRASTHTPLVYMCWVNKVRQQFVWETSSTTMSNVMFEDRVDFTQHFLDPYKDIQEIIQLKVGDDIQADSLNHYFGEVRTKSLVLVPFINQQETVAITVIESDEVLDLDRFYHSIISYNNAMVNVLATYLEVVDLHEQQKEWEDYETSLDKINYRMHRVKILQIMLAEMQKYLRGGGISILSHGMGTWNVILNAEGDKNIIPIGLKMDGKSISSEALMKGEPFFTMHFNNSPKRISVGEGLTVGASLLMPISIFDRRQALIIAYDENPLSFKENTKHKIINLARVAGLNIQATIKKLNAAENLLTHSYGAYIPELWEVVLEQQIKKYDPQDKNITFFGLISPDDVPALRTKFGLEELQLMQEDFVRFLNPSIYGFPGFIGFNSDYVYAVIIQGESTEIITQWMEKLNTRLMHGITLSNGYTVKIGFKFGITQVDDTVANAYQLVSKAKKAHAEVISSSNKSVIFI